MYRLKPTTSEVELRRDMPATITTTVHISHFQTKNFLSLVAGREKLIISHLWGVYILIFSPVGLLS